MTHTFKQGWQYYCRATATATATRCHCHYTAVAFMLLLLVCYGLAATIKSPIIESATIYRVINNNAEFPHLIHDMVFARPGNTQDAWL